MGVVRWPVGRVLVDGLLAVAAGAVMTVGTHQAAARQVPPSQPPDRLGYALVLAAAAVLVVRRVWPLPVLAATVVLVDAYLLVRYPYGPVVLALMIAMYTVASQLPTRRSLAACGVAAIAFLAPELVAGAREPLTYQALWLVAAPTGFLLLPWAVGTVVRQQRESAARAREEEARRLAYEERLRIAREVHDVVGHGLAVINMQAGIALHVLDRRPEQARVALDAIRRTSKDALDELRGTLAVFRRPADAPRRPEPGLGQLDSLVAAMADSGLPVKLVVTGQRADLPAAVDHAAYRIVQESLTNVLRHAGPAAATVHVEYRPGEVRLQITDDGRGARGTAAERSGGHGIPGMRERAAAVGGTLEAGPLPEGGFGVRARLPFREGGS